MSEYELPISDERLAKLAEPLGVEARQVLGRIIEAEAALREEQPDLGMLLEGFEDLPQDDKDRLLRIVTEFMQARRRQQVEAEGMATFARQAVRVIERAQELEPSFGARGERATVGQAVEILKRHGEKPSISEEALRIPLYDD